MKEKFVKKLEKIPIAHRMATDKHFRTVVFAGFSTAVNIAYVCYNGFLGFTKSSVWFFTMFVYYAIIAVMRAVAVAKSRSQNRNNDYIIMRIDGILLLFLTIALTGIILLSLKFKLMHNYGTVPMIALTTYTFYKVITSIINLRLNKKIHSPIIRTIRNINFADALVSLISTQMSMYATFGDPDEGHTMSVVTGAVICLLLVIMAVMMIVKSKKTDNS